MSIWDWLFPTGFPASPSKTTSSQQVAGDGAVQISTSDGGMVMHNNQLCINYNAKTKRLYVRFSGRQTPAMRATSKLISEHPLVSMDYNDRGVAVGMEVQLL